MGPGIFKVGSRSRMHAVLPVVFTYWSPGAVDSLPSSRAEPDSDNNVCIEFLLYRGLHIPTRAHACDHVATERHSRVMSEATDIIVGYNHLHHCGVNWLLLRAS